MSDIEFSMFYTIEVPFANAKATILNFNRVHVRFALGHEEDYIDIATIKNKTAAIWIGVTFGLLLIGAIVGGAIYYRNEGPV